MKSNKRQAITKKFLFLFFPVLELRRFFRNLETYSFNYKLVEEFDYPKMFHNIPEHFSLLYWKYNKRENGLIIPFGKIFSFWKYVEKKFPKRFSFI